MVAGRFGGDEDVLVADRICVTDGLGLTPIASCHPTPCCLVRNLLRIRTHCYHTGLCAEMPGASGAYIRSRGWQIARARFRASIIIWYGRTFHLRITESAPLVAIFKGMIHSCKLQIARGSHCLVLRESSGQAKQTRSPLESLVV